MEDVVIVGAGPTGLTLASELGLWGVRATVLEREPKPSGLSKALGLQARTLEMLDHRGLMERFSAGHRSAPFLNFAMFQLDPRAIAFGHPLPLIIPQAEVEALLAGRAQELGAQVRRGHTLAALRQDGDGVVLTVDGPEGRYELSCRYLVGCDGGHSAVRKLAGIDFPGLPPTVVARFGDVTLGPGAMSLIRAAAPELPPSGFGIQRTATGNFALVPLAPDLQRIAAIEWGQTDIDRAAPMDLAELQAALVRVIGTEVPMSNPRWLTRAVDNSRLAAKYRDRRVLLAGDAAHVHFAYGGMGMQTGIQDAGNLGWKLAAMVRGFGTEALLDSYGTERHPVGERVMMSTRAATELARPGEHVTALRQVFAELLQDQSTFRRIMELVSSVDVHYDLGGGHPLVGRFAPDLALKLASGPAHLASLMHAGRGVLLDLTRGGLYSPAAAGWRDRVNTNALTAESDSPDAPAALLIRPDGYVAWAAAVGADATKELPALAAALLRWFGASAAS